MPRIGYGIIAVILILALLPFALVARSRSHTSTATAVHLVFDMDKQPKKKTQSTSPVFADSRAMRPEITGTLAREDLSLQPELLNDPHDPRLIDHNAQPIALSNPSLYAALVLGRNRPAGMTDEQFNAVCPVNVSNPNATDADIARDTFYVKTVPSPIKVTSDFLHRGQERFNIYCAPCHGQSGYGDGPVAIRAKSLQDAGTDPTAASGWIAPANFHDPQFRSRPDGHLFNTITNGIRTMPPYDKQISVLDRWAIVAYLRALQTSQNADHSLSSSAPPSSPMPLTVSQDSALRTQN